MNETHPIGRFTLVVSNYSQVWFFATYEPKRLRGGTQCFVCGKKHYQVGNEFLAYRFTLEDKGHNLPLSRTEMGASMYACSDACAQAMDTILAALIKEESVKTSYVADELKSDQSDQPLWKMIKKRMAALRKK